ncbi:MAG: MarC family protein [Candidatus Omnitrophica bacterium]|nr:MarC family protein [Candidatus Omnitrophota bacterium]MCM8806683.1 MarC family protein [Candidatus Omnitrophota bacterium]
MGKFIASLFSLFITLDPIGTIPFYIGYTHSFPDEKRNKILFISISVCFFIGVLFLYFGEFLFKYLKISFSDFLIASGIILLIFSITEFIGTSQFKVEDEELCIVPLAIPLLAGPAFLTTILISKNFYGTGITLICLFLNIIFAYIILFFSQKITHAIGKTGIKGIIKILSLFLASLGIKYIREGIGQIIKY